MLRGLIVVELVALAALAAFAVSRRFRGAGGSGDRPKLPFATRWTEDSLPALRAPQLKVCKSAGVMTVFDADEPVKSYRVITGSAGGDKQREGDCRTPEGQFTVCMKNPSSRYVLSLGLDYPNAEDAARGLRAGLITEAEHDAIVRAGRQGRTPPWDTALGGEIMIHGCKGERTSTLGCVSMDDGDVRELYSAVPVGTAVMIVP